MSERAVDRGARLIYRETKRLGVRPGPLLRILFTTLLGAALLLFVPAANAQGNAPPIARAPADFAVPSVEPFTLDGSNSSDPDGDPLVCQWRPQYPPRGHFTNETACKTSFVPEGTGVFHFQLLVQDPTGVNDSAASRVPNRGSSSASLTVAVANTPPRFLHINPPAGDLYAEEGVRTVDSEKYSWTGPGPSAVGVQIEAFDPDEGNLTVTWFLDGKKIGDDGAYGGTVSSSSGVSQMAGTYHLRAVADDGAANDTVEWTVHISPRGVAGTAPFWSGAPGVALLVAAAGTVGAALWLWRRSRA